MITSKITLLFLSLFPFVYVQSSLETVERFAFYERAKKAYAVVATGCVCVFCYCV